MKPSELVETLLEDDDVVGRIVAKVEQYLGDVITPETDDATAKEECWTLCIDAANDMIGQGPKAIAVAKEACAQLGYPPKGYRQARERPVDPDLANVGDLLARSDLSPDDRQQLKIMQSMKWLKHLDKIQLHHIKQRYAQPERQVKQTGVVRGPYTLPKY